MRLKRWVWDILQDGKEHYFSEYEETEHGILYKHDMFLPGGILHPIRRDNHFTLCMTNGWTVRKYHIEQKLTITFPEDLFKI